MEVCYDLEVLLKMMVKQIKKFAVNHVHFQFFSVKEKAMCAFFFEQDTAFSVQEFALETRFTNFCWQLREV